MAIEEFIVLDNATARRSVARFVKPIARSLLRIGVTPDGITWFGCAITLIISAAFLARGQFLVGATLLGVFSLIDLLDGTMARMLGTAGPWGAFLDSTLDRISDSAVICALIYFYLGNDSKVSDLAVTAGIISLVMSLLTSYARAKAESLDAKCTVGLAERAERNLIIIVALLVSGLTQDITPYALVLLAVASTFTVIQRVLFVRKQLVTQN
jgi:phosphatidylglycerophosphate synthase